MAHVSPSKAAPGDASGLSAYTAPMRRPTLRLVATVAALSPVSLVLAHNLSFLAAYGSNSDDVLRATGHAEAWTSAVRAVIAVSAALGLAAFVRLLALWRTASRVERELGVQPRTDWRALGRTVLGLWVWLAVLTAAWFLVQENLERLAMGQPLPGLDPLLEGGLVGPLLIVPAISLIVALVGGLFRWGIAALRARIAAAIAAHRRARPATVRRPSGADARPSSLLARNRGLRAPPIALAG